MSRILCNIDWLEAVMDDAGLDVVVACSGRNTAYLSGVHQPPSRFSTYYQDNANSPRRSFVVWPRDGEPTLILQRSSSVLAEEHGWIADIRAYEEWVESPYQRLVDVLAEQGYQESTVGIERSELGFDRWRHILDALPEAHFVECSDMFERVRNQKTNAEVQLIEEAEHLLDKAFEQTYREASPGDRPHDLETSMLVRLRELGADASYGWMQVKDTPFTRHTDRTTSLSHHDVIRADFICYHRGYVANLSRHAVVGEPTSDDRETYRTVRDVHRRTIERSLYPGTAGRDVFVALQERAREAGLSGPEILAGHGIGVWSVHERPIFHRAEEWEIQAGMVIVMETIIDQFWQLQDMLYIDTDGPRWMSEPASTDEMYVIA